MPLPQPLHKVAESRYNHVWALPAVLNFFLGGAAAGFYILWGLSTSPFSQQSQIPFSSSMLAAFLVAAGFGSVAIEAGRPFRARYLVAHCRHSWMSRETAAGAVFIIAVIIDVVTKLPAGRALAIFAAGALLVSQAMVVFRCTAVSVWRHPIIPVMFISAGISAGYALILLNRYTMPASQAPIAPHIDVIALAGIAVNFCTWVALLRAKRAAFEHEVTRKLLQLRSTIMVTVVGHIIPVILLMNIAPWSFEAAHKAPLPAAAVAALALLSGNWVQKRGLMQHAQYVCKMQLEDQQCQ